MFSPLSMKYFTETLTYLHLQYCFAFLKQIAYKNTLY